MKNEIGTDPTMVDVIETLDVPVPEKKIEPKNENKQNNNDKKPEKKGSFIKNLLFIILVLALMGGVAFGVYYYLRLAKNNENNVNVTPAFNLNKMQINEGDEVPQSLSEYGDFSKIDISNCKLDTSEVKNNVPGNYTYYVMCNGSKYSESFVVKSKDGSDEPVTPTVTKRLNVTTYFNYTIKGEQLNIERLISSDDNLTFEFANKEKYKEDMYNIGLQKVEIKAVDSENNENTYYAFEHWTDCIKAYKKWIYNKYPSYVDYGYIDYLIKLPYATDKDYKNKLEVLALELYKKHIPDEYESGVQIYN